MPDDVRDPCGRMIEGSYPDAGIVGSGKKGIARTEAGADDAELRVTLLLQPVEAATGIDHALAAGIESTADVGGDGVVGAVNFGGAADIVIGQGQAQDGNAQPVQDTA